MLSFAGFVSKNVKIIPVNASLMNKCKMIKTIFQNNKKKWMPNLNLKYTLFIMKDT